MDELTWLYALVSVFIVSLVSFVGIITLPLKGEKLKELLLFFVSFSAGALFGDAFIHLLPEVMEEAARSEDFGIANASIYILLGIIVFFVLEKIVCWRHCHIQTSDVHPHSLGIMNLIGDGFHNLLDGMIIAGSYMVSFHLGLATTIAVVLHEIPQEIGDFGILLYAGFSKNKALFFNFVSALTAFIGVIITAGIQDIVNNFTLYLVPFTIGGFIYIAGSDLIPEMHKEKKPIKSFFQLMSLISGILVMYFLIFLE